MTIVDASKPLPGMEIEPGYRPAEQWFAHDNAIFDVAWCHRDDRLLTASGDQSVKLWDVETNVCHRTFKRHNGSVKAVSVRPDGGCGDVFASCGRDGTIALWDARESRRRGRRGVGTGAASDPYARETPTAVIARAHEPPAAMGGGTAVGCGFSEVGVSRCACEATKQVPLPMAPVGESLGLVGVRGPDSSMAIKA